MKRAVHTLSAARRLAAVRLTQCRVGAAHVARAIRNALLKIGLWRAAEEESARCPDGHAASGMYCWSIPAAFYRCLRCRRCRMQSLPVLRRSADAARAPSSRCFRHRPRAFALAANLRRQSVCSRSRKTLPSTAERDIPPRRAAIDNGRLAVSPEFPQQRDTLRRPRFASHRASNELPRFASGVMSGKARTPVRCVTVCDYSPMISDGQVTVLDASGIALNW